MVCPPLQEARTAAAMLDSVQESLPRPPERTDQHHAQRPAPTCKMVRRQLPCWFTPPASPLHQPQRASRCPSPTCKMVWERLLCWFISVWRTARCWFPFLSRPSDCSTLRTLTASAPGTTVPKGPLSFTSRPALRFRMSCTPACCVSWVSGQANKGSPQPDRQCGASACPGPRCWFAVLQAGGGMRLQAGASRWAAWVEAGPQMHAAAGPVASLTSARQRVSSGIQVCPASGLAGVQQVHTGCHHAQGRQA